MIHNKEVLAAVTIAVFAVVGASLFLLSGKLVYIIVCVLFNWELQ